MQPLKELHLDDKLVHLNADAKSEMMTMLDQANTLDLQFKYHKDLLRDLTERALAEARAQVDRPLGQISGQVSEVGDMEVQT